MREVGRWQLEVGGAQVGATRRSPRAGAVGPRAERVARPGAGKVTAGAMTAAPAVISGPHTTMLTSLPGT